MIKRKICIASFLTSSVTPVTPFVIIGLLSLLGLLSDKTRMGSLVIGLICLSVLIFYDLNGNFATQTAEQGVFSRQDSEAGRLREKQLRYEKQMRDIEAEQRRESARQMREDREYDAGVQ